MSTWRDDHITDKQKQLIADMQEFGPYSLPGFYGMTKGEAADYIEQYGKIAREDINMIVRGY
jgi:hypothetical protein